MALNMNVQDRWLWLGVGVLAFIGIRCVAHGLRETVRLTEIHDGPKQQQPRELVQGNEDAIKLDSLQTLLNSSNYSIREAYALLLRIGCSTHQIYALTHLPNPSATNILIDRFKRNSAAQSLLNDALKSPDRNLREQAERAKQLIEPPPTVHWTLMHPYHESGQSPSPRSRIVEESPEERVLRRRRREAMVIATDDNTTIIDVGPDMDEDATGLMTEVLLSEIEERSWM